MPEKTFILLGDVVDSRNIKKKETFLHSLNMAINNANKTYQADFKAPLKTIKGLDELGGALKTAANFYQILTALTEFIHPVQLRVSLVYGVVDIGSGDIVQMDGPAIHKASETIEQLRQKKLLFDISIVDPLLDSTFTGQLNLLGLIKKQWSPRQMEVFRKYRQYHNQSKVAGELGITQQAVSSFLNRCMYRQIELLEGRLSHDFYSYSLKINR